MAKEKAVMKDLLALVLAALMCGYAPLLSFGWQELEATGLRMK